MLTKQKIKKLIVVLIVIMVFAISLIFHNSIHGFVIRVFKNKFKTVTSSNNMLVHFINVDQADAVAINFPDGKVMLIDSGCEEYNVTYSNYLKENVINSQRTKYIDYLVLTHADMDHVGGTMKLIKNFEIGTIFLPKVASSSVGYQDILSYVQKNCKYKLLGDEFCIGNNEYLITFFEQLNNSNTNDSSQVVKVEMNNTSFLFTGDISQRVEDEYINEYENKLDADVLKVAHHGSKTATGEEFLRVVSPKFSVISVGLNNSYDHPSEEVLKRLDSIGSEVLRTDKDGNILFVVGDDYGLSVLKEAYHITVLTLDYRYLVVIINMCLMVVCVVIIVKKEKKKR